MKRDPVLHHPTRPRGGRFSRALPRTSSQVWLSLLLAAAWVLTPGSASAQNGDKPGEAQPPPPADLQVPPANPKSPAEALATFRLPPGFRLELVAAEPMVESPVAMAFGPEGRLWVIEMRGYMPNSDGVGETNAVGRLVTLEDTNRDGRMDQRKVFLDHLYLPRALALVGDGVLVAEPPRLWFCRDRNGDGIADEKIEVANDYATQNDPKLGKNSNPEHASNGLLLAMDNWIYSLYHPWRYRYDLGRWRREPTSSRGQWGITQDDAGRLVYNSNSDHLRGDLVPDGYTQRNPHYAAAGINVQLARDQTVWPARVNPGINRGYQPGVLRDGRLASFTGACGPVIYRGDQFPAEFRGNAFVAEPAGNLIRRCLLTETNGIVTAVNAYSQDEFLTSTDERFRPVNLYNGPDGALYIVDLYRGLIQHRIYLTSFLRKQVQDRRLEQPINQGRIYRVVSEGQPIRRASLLAKSGPRDWVKQLAHPNGWTRDTAQRLLVERRPASVLSELRRLARAHDQPHGSLHALWSLDGMNALDLETARTALAHEATPLRTAAIRLYEKRIQSPPSAEQLAPLLALLQEDTRAAVQWQLAFSLGALQQWDALVTLLSQNTDHPYIRDAVLSGLGGHELDFLHRLFAHPAWQSPDPHRAAALQAVAKSLAGPRRSDTTRTLLDLAVAQPTEQRWRQWALLDGLLSLAPPPPKNRPAPAIKPIELDAEPPALQQLRSLPDEELAARVRRLEPLLQWPGKQMAVVSAVKPLTEFQKTLFEAGKELYAVTCGACHQPNGKGQEGLAPPLADADWVTGSVARLTRLVLHGIRGPLTVNGRTYELEMPAMGVLDDEQLAALLTYIRREWGHTASAIEPSDLKKVRSETEQRDAAWTESELLKLP